MEGLRGLRGGCLGFRVASPFYSPFPWIMRKGGRELVGVLGEEEGRRVLRQFRSYLKEEMRDLREHGEREVEARVVEKLRGEGT